MLHQMLQHNATNSTCRTHSCVYVYWLLVYVTFGTRNISFKPAYGQSKSCFISWATGYWVITVSQNSVFFLESKHGHHRHLPVVYTGDVGWLTWPPTRRNPRRGWILNNLRSRFSSRWRSWWIAKRLRRHSIHLLSSDHTHSSEATYRETTATRCLSLIYQVAGKALHPAKTSAMSALLLGCRIGTNWRILRYFSAKINLKVTRTYNKTHSKVKIFAKAIIPCIYRFSK